ncbi:MAG TPA: DUF4388 domain-containing protein [Candidatus Binatia bacterium]|jgi:hypothetical protein
MQGTFSQVSLTDVIQLCILAKKSGLLKLSKGKEIVEIYFVKGEVIHAACPLDEGERAFFYPLTWNEGNFVLIKDSAAPPRTVERPTGELLSELLNVSRELEQIQEVVPTENSVFRIAESDNRRVAPITLSPDQWRVLSRINGARSVKSIAETARLPYFDVAKTIHSLHGEGLVELLSGTARAAAPSDGVVAKPTVPDPVPQGFFDRMVHGLAEVSGPIASVVVRDQIAALGASAEAFPRSRVIELVDSVSQVIPDKKLKARFQQRMNDEIRALKTPPPNFTM